MFTPAVLVADYAGTLDLSGVTELRIRATNPPTAPFGDGRTSAISLDFFVQPRLRLRMLGGHWEYSFAASPSMTETDMELGGLFQGFVNGSTGIAWFNHQVRLSLNEDVAYGLINYASAPASAGTMTNPGVPQSMTATGPPTPPTTSNTINALPTGPITTLTSNTNGSISVQASRRTSMSLSGSYLRSGGADEPSRLQIPEQMGPRVDGSLSYSLTRIDQLVTLAYGQMADFDGGGVCVDANGNPFPVGTVCRSENQIAQVTEGLRHSLGPHTVLTFSAGAALVRTRVTDQFPPAVPALVTVPAATVVQTTSEPIFDVSLAHRFEERGTAGLTVDVGVAPGIDIITGRVVERVQGTGALVLVFLPDVTARVNATVLQTIPTSGPLATSLVSGGAEVAYRADRWVRLAVGATGVWQTQDTLGNFLSVFGYFNVTVRMPALRF